MSDHLTSPAEDGAGREAALAWLQVYNLAGPNTGDGPHSKLNTLTREFESFGRHAKASAESRAAAAEAEVARLRER